MLIAAILQDQSIWQRTSSQYRSMNNRSPTRYTLGQVYRYALQKALLRRYIQYGIFNGKLCVNQRSGIHPLVIPGPD